MVFLFSCLPFWLHSDRGNTLRAASDAGRAPIASKPRDRTSMSEAAGRTGSLGQLRVNHLRHAVDDLRRGLAGLGEVDDVTGFELDVDVHARINSGLDPSDAERELRRLERNLLRR